MRELEFRALCTARNLDSEQVDAAVEAVRDLDAFAGDNGATIENMSVDLLRNYLSALICTGQNTVERLVALGRYAMVDDRNDLYLHIVGVIGGRTVLPSIAERAAEVAGEQVRDAVFADLPVPPLGSPQSDYPVAVAGLVKGLQEQVDLATARQILAGNHHRIPREAFLEEKKLYEQAGLDAVLAHRHAKLVATLEEHARTGKPWYEQMITPAVVDLVRANPEIQAGVRHGDWIYVAKIPYAPVQFLEEQDPTRRRYYQCHCTLARASIVESVPAVDAEFCYCSAGYEKFPFDVIFDQPTEVEVLQSALAGDAHCRFRVKVPAGARL